MSALPIIHDDGWELASYPGDDEQPAFSLRYRRWDMSARMAVALWESVQLRLLAQGVPAMEREAAQVEIQCAEIARRVRDPETGEAWTVETVQALGGRSAAAWDWLRHLLFRPALRSAPQGSRAKRLSRRCKLEAKSLILQAGIVGTV